MIDVEMPQMGESIVEGTLTRWLKKPGDKVERDEPLFEISTDKVDTEIPSPAAGTLAEVLVQEGTTVAIKTIVARVNDGAEAPPAKQTSASAPQPTAAPGASKPAQAPPPPPSQPTEQKVDVGPSAAAQNNPTTFLPSPQPAGAGPYPIEPDAQAAPAAPAEEQGPLSPLVRKMAREYNIDLSQIKGTGAGNRITKQDVEAYMSSQAARTYSAAAAPATSSPAPSAPSAPSLPLAESAKVRVEPMTNMRLKIAEHMVNSKRTSAHVTTVHRVDMTKVAKLRDKSKTEFQARNGFSLTFLPFVTAATAEALRAFPLFNASIDGKNIVYYREINIGIAVALEGGLIVPVIRNADEKNVAGLQRAIVDLATRARSRQLKPDEVQGGTFSITNFGSFGSIFATPVINQPQVAILGIGAVEKVPAVIEGDAIAIRSQAHLALTFDHRLIDGALADQFCQKVKSILEGWSVNIL
ncbi:MAG TPA: 2-oxoglutarate dehydrogenase, E2 component, dihydrolipoamide succinyltransferase [Bryobacteraceae bacterium]|jgi:2-oxoglutarate dehydrogenase E2 component (dihydrolipoamide succinyltransferase)|nr:2-oxoglutarate dehydrogenase, E2 component, dihydrolipoamide succinyltransferase [Bryobacteraceae bacterium]